LKASLNLEESQATTIKTELQEVFSGMRAQFQAVAEGGDRSAIREQMNQRMTAVFKKNLTPEQFKQYQQIRRQASESRAGQIWAQSEDGEIKPVAVKFGISDDNYTQVLGKNINQGDVVITRIRNVKK
jgi:HlyD family secretion protein